MADTPVVGKVLGISDRFAAQCSPVIDSNYDTCGTVTRATIAHLTKTQLAAIFHPGGYFADLDAWFKHSIEMKACGTQRYALYDWIMANADRRNFRAALFPGIKAVKGPGILHPFILARQVSIVNRDHWKITAGYTADNAIIAAAADGAGVLTKTYHQGGVTYTGTRGVRIESRYSVPVNAGFFRPMDVIHIFNTANGVFQHGAWRVIDSVTNPTGTYCYATIESLNTGSSGPYDATPGALNPCYIIPGVNNVNDYEKWCYNRPTIDPRKMVPFWRQTMRQARCIDSQYREVFARLNESNEAFREFGDLPLAERNRQDELEAQKRFVNAFFYNKPISSNQTLDLYQSLDAIHNVGTNIPGPTSAVLVAAGGVMAYRANFVGVRQQLRDCGQLWDLLGNPINWFEWLDLNYAIKRARETMLGRSVTDIDWYTNSEMRALAQVAYVAYLTSRYGGLAGAGPFVAVDHTNKLNDLGQVYDSYKVHRPGGVNINILEDVYFDDLLDQWRNINQEAGGNVMVCLDIGKPGPGGGSIYWAQIAANRKSYTTAKIEELAKYDPTYRCVMETVSQEQTLTSEEGTVVVECPFASAWVENIQLTNPVTTGRTTPSYLDLY